jgi:hypothetical protein
VSGIQSWKCPGHGENVLEVDRDRMTKESKILGGAALIYEEKVMGI